MTMLNIRPHHLICIFCFQGEGYDDDFVAHMQQIHDKFIAADADKLQIKIVSGGDAVCAKCPECAKQALVAELDREYLQILQLEVGAIYSLGEIKQRIKQCLTMADFHRICSKCSWYKDNLCAPIVVRLVDVDSKTADHD